ncbi:hypothetical protein DYB30_008811 [Aphanomyces astaci]|uniref:Uncharacterized protein n=1 Tax=Aphanomyces astaci TaxID=112090 RepID=A0A397CDU3_APHAT|nr:hypothetical protein DYB30_008811 [Aphanomyces astaci]
MFQTNSGNGGGGGMAAAVHRFMGMYEVKNTRSWRLEDMDYRTQAIQHREEQIQRQLEWRREDIARPRRIHKLANERRLVDSRAYQLSALSQVSLLITIFSRQAYVESHPPETTNATLVFFQGSTSAISILCLMLCMLRCLMLTMATLKCVLLVIDSSYSCRP